MAPVLATSRCAQLCALPELRALVELEPGLTLPGGAPAFGYLVLTILSILLGLAYVLVRSI